jgi:hypothetical protein
MTFFNFFQKEEPRNENLYSPLCLYFPQISLVVDDGFGFILTFSNYYHKNSQQFSLFSPSAAQHRLPYRFVLAEAEVEDRMVVDEAVSVAVVEVVEGAFVHH